MQNIDKMSRAEKNKLLLDTLAIIHEKTTPERRKEMLAEIKISHAHMGKEFHEFWEVALSDGEAPLPA